MSSPQKPIKIKITTTQRTKERLYIHCPRVRDSVSSRVLCLCAAAPACTPRHPCAPRGRAGCLPTPLASGVPSALRSRAAALTTVVHYSFSPDFIGVMDRSWMSKPKRETAYQDGVEQFLAFCLQDRPHDSEILCPSKKCKNRLNQSHDELMKTHLRCDGILQGYTTWVHHGENYESPSLAFIDVPNNTRNFTNPSVPRAVISNDHRHGGLDDMQELLQAAFGGAEIYDSLPSISEGEVDDDVQSGFANMEHNLSEDMNPAENCLHGWTQESFTSLLDLLSAALSPETNLPKTYYEAKKIIRVLVKIHACPNDCMLFRGDTADQDFYHVCKSSRWKDTTRNGSADNEQKRKKKPAKVLRYFPLLPRLQRLFSTNKTSDDMRWHDLGRTKDGKLRHPADGEAWKDFDRRYPEFASDARMYALVSLVMGLTLFGT
ncbi:LOW QUALITY PROTEIN: hypothetical protein U9M48_032581 [Paspalum notatum var. saurae]|uniref:Transposase-associated domain-containing protein n=1 Tax=Paspalum notatum var. saurae TaxID=547442 RepID=A0AAQ3X5K3_PASNO